MLKYVIAAVLSASLLAACDPVKVPTTVDLAALIAGVQSAVATTCAVGHLVVPTAETIADIYAKGDPNLQSVKDIAAALEAVLCSNTPKATRNGPTVAGVPVKTL